MIKVLKEKKKSTKNNLPNENTLQKFRRKIFRQIKTEKIHNQPIYTKNIRRFFLSRRNKIPDNNLDLHSYMKK